MTLFDSTGAEIKLTPDQKRIALVLATANGGRVTLRVTQGANPIRETTTAAALVRKGLAEKVSGKVYRATLEGIWLFDGLAIENRLGKIPARRS